MDGWMFVCLFTQVKKFMPCPKGRRHWLKANLSKNLDDAIKGAKQYVGEISSAQGMLLYHIASKIKPQIRDHLLFLSKYVAENKLNTEARVNAALEYLLQNAKDKSIDVKGLEEACGVGIVVTPEEIEKEVNKLEEEVKNYETT